jgi:hypothetical protein
VKLRPGDQVWFVVAREWPRYEVETGCYVELVADVAQAVQLELAEATTATAALNTQYGVTPNPRNRTSGAVAFSCAEG